MKELTVQEAALAWAQGRIVEVMGPTSIEWAPVIKVGGGDGEWLPGVFTVSDGKYRFRLAPVPPAKKWRPWTAEEVPVGALTRSKVPSEILMIIGRNETGVRLADDDGWYGYDSLVKARTYSTDGGKTWLPCGVEVTE